MMGALDQLREEHRVILRIAQRMEDAASGPPDGLAPETFLHAAVDFIRVYADKNHHGKEEGALFEMMSGNPRLAGMAAILGQEHVEGRELVSRLEQALDTHQDQAVRKAVLAYVSFIRDHIAKEDDMIFDAAERELTPSDSAELDRAFAEVEAQVLGTDGLGRLLERMDVTARSPR
jgi:hemerythrin-like domain-containing protein